MTRCVLCGGENDNGLLLCLHHTVGDTDWAKVNRQMNDGLLRNAWPAYIPEPAALVAETWVEASAGEAG